MGLSPAQIKGRIKSLAAKSHADARALMRIYMMERFLERIAMSEHKDCFIIKGGMFMVGKYKVITLCGSTKFKDEFIKAQKELTLAGNIVISVGLFGHSGDNEVWTNDTKEMLDDMHKRKIDMADSISVINVGGYIGESTRSEIEYAKEHGWKLIRIPYWEYNNIENILNEILNKSDEVK